MKALRNIMIAVLSVTVLSGCAIGPGPVVEDHEAEIAGPGALDQQISPSPRDQLSITEPEELVEKFLMASAAATPEARAAIMSSYLVPGDAWKPTGDLKVVRIDIEEARQTTTGGFEVSVNVQHIGVLTDRGELVPSVQGPEELTFEVMGSRSKLMLHNPPRELLLSEEGLNTYYTARPLYFDGGGVELVPDLRYVSTGLLVEEQSNQLIGWLYDGPSAWLANAVRRLPEETRPGVTKAVRQGDNLVVDLSAAPDEAVLNRLARQLAKTLLVSPLSTLQINISGQSKEKDLSAPPDPRISPPKRFAVAEGKAWRLGDDNVLQPILLSENDNRNIVSVAFAREEAAVAIVQSVGSDQRLRIGTKESLSTASLPRVSKISQPHWLDNQPKVALVLADGAIYEVTADGNAERKLQHPGLTAMSIAPDGRRMALVIDGALYLASRSQDGTIVGPNQAYRIPTMFTSIQAVAFSKSHELTVAGGNASGVRLMRLGLNGTGQSPFDDLWSVGSTIRQLVADPQSGNALFEKDGLAWAASQSRSEPLPHSPANVAQPPVVSAPSFEG